MRYLATLLVLCLVAGCSPKLVLTGGPLALDDARQAVSSEYHLGPIQRLTDAPIRLLHFSLCTDKDSNACVVWQNTSDYQHPLQPANLVMISPQGSVSGAISLSNPRLDRHPTAWRAPDGQPRIVQITGNGGRQCRVAIYRFSRSPSGEIDTQLAEESQHTLDLWSAFGRLHTDWYHINRLVTVGETGEVWAIGHFQDQKLKPIGFLGAHPVATYNRWFTKAFPDGPLHVVQNLPDESDHFDIAGGSPESLSFDPRGWAAAIAWREHWGAWGAHVSDSRTILSVWNGHAWHSAVWSSGEVLSLEDQEKLAGTDSVSRSVLLAHERMWVFAGDACFAASLGDADGWGRLPLTWLSATRIGTREAARAVAANKNDLLAVMVTEKGDARCMVFSDDQWRGVSGAAIALERYPFYTVVRTAAAPDGSFHLVWKGSDELLYHASLRRDSEPPAPRQNKASQ